MAGAMQKQTYEHKGVTITFEPAKGEYRATVNGKPVVGLTLVAMKAKIETQLKQKGAK